MDVIKSHIWESRVRDYEVDFQGIVNNANYYHYLDEARSIFFHENGINVKSYADKGFNIVLVSAELNFKKPLRFYDNFLIETIFKSQTKIRYCFEQKIYITTNSEYIESVLARNIVCVTKNNKPCYLEDISKLAI